MAMIGGSVTVNDDETHTGSGLALELYEARKAAAASALAAMDPDTVLAGLPRLQEPDQASAKQATIDGLKTARIKLLRGLADDANVLCPVIVAHIQNNARVSLAEVVATVSPTDSLGRTPNPNDPNALIQGPSAPVDLPVTGAAGATTLGVH